MGSLFSKKREHDEKICKMVNSHIYYWDVTSRLSNEVKNSKQSAVKKGKKVIKKEQVAYLKKHEKELTEYVKIQILVKLSMIGIVCA
ncbi:TPA: hypothetical protein ACIENT_002151 [Streptococcus agalactiae]